MAAGDQADQDAADGLVLPDDDPGHLTLDRRRSRAKASGSSGSWASISPEPVMLDSMVLVDLSAAKRASRSQPAHPDAAFDSAEHFSMLNGRPVRRAQSREPGVLCAAA